MKTHAEIREAIATVLETVPNIGQVHRYERYANQASALAALYGWNGQLRGWHIRRVQVQEGGAVDEVPEETALWEIRGYMAIADALATELECDGLVDAIRAAFRADPTVGGTVMTTWAEGLAGIQVQDSGPAMFAGVLCHKVILRLATRQFAA